ncbi:response regulator [Bizionia sp. KMM 8389]
MEVLISSIYNKIVQRTFLLPFLAFIFTTILVFTLWDKSVEDYQVWAKQQIQQTGEISSEKFTTIITEEIVKVANLKHRLEFTEGRYHEFWDLDANRVIEQSQAIRFIEWIDSSMIIKKINPLKGNESALNLDISKIAYRNTDWLLHSKDSTINITPWSELTQGGKAFLVDIPTYYNNKFQGTVTAGMDFTYDFTDFANQLKDYAIEIYDNKGTLIYNHNMQNKAKTDPSFIYKQQLDVKRLNNYYWHLNLYPTNDLLFFTNKRTFINYTLIFGIILAFLISMLIYFYLKALEATKRVLNINKKLAAVNKHLNLQKLKAENASKSKTDFLSNMSHEIRTPLHAILGFIQILKSSNLGTKEQEYIAHMDNSSNNLLAIVNDILEIHKIESGKMILNKKIFSPVIQLQILSNTYEYHFKEKGLGLSLNIIKHNNHNVLSDLSKYNQIITNILKNALKFTTNGGIEIFYEEEKIDDKLRIIIRIKDSGIGISQNKLKAIFNRFTQIENSLKKQHEGSGLGLAISKEFAELLGGSISVKSALNEGSEFTFTALLPISEEDSFTIKETYENLKLPHLKVLVVDDNQVNVLVLKKLLEDVDIQVDAVSNGQLAIDKFRSNTYNLLLMDIHMPEMDGYEATEIIRQEDSEVIIIGLSANVTSTAIQKALDSGMTNYITKPFTKERLYKLILTYLS